MKGKKSLRKILLNTAAGVTATALSILPNLSSAENNYELSEKIISDTEILNDALEKKINDNKTFQIPRDRTKYGGDKSKQTYTNSKGETIVSFANQKQADEFYKRLEKFTFFKNSATLPDNQLHPMYGLNSHVPAWNVDFATDKNFYGSGDVDGDGDIDMDDYNSSIAGADPFNDGTHRGDTDLNGYAGDANDKAIILDYINGNRTHINMWELETVAEKKNHLEKAFAIDPTSEISAFSSGWLCGNYSSQTFINFNGVYEINNSTFAGDNMTNLQYDLSHNGIFRISLRKLGTRTASGAHVINNAYLGSPENQDASTFENNINVEPQTDEIQEIGDYSLNDYSEKMWAGYFYSDFLQQWGYGVRNLVNYDINTNPPTRTFKTADLIPSWNPFKNGIKDAQFPEDKDVEYVPGIEENLETGEVTNLMYPDNTKVEKTVTSTQVMGGSKDQYNYDVNVLWELTAGAYNPQNTLDAIKNQTLRVRDTTPPVYNEETGEWSDSSGAPVSVLEEIVVTGDVCQSDTTITKTGTDPSGNETKHIIEKIGDPYEGKPYLVSDPHEGDTLRVEFGQAEIPENIGGWPEYADDKAEVTMNYTIENIEIKDLDWLKKMIFTAQNECGNVSLDTVIRYYKIPSGVGVDDVNENLLENLVLLGNPAKNYIQMAFMGQETKNLDIDVYNLKRQKVQDNDPKQFTSKEIQKYNVSNLESGLYLLKIEDTRTKEIGFKKVLIMK